MSTETVVPSAPSADSEVVDVFKGKEVSMAEYDKYRQSNELPERFKAADTEEPAPSQEIPEGEKPESEPDSDPDKQQEKPAKPKHQTSAERVAVLNAKVEELWSEEDPDLLKIAQITATIEKIEKGASAKRKTEVAPVAEQPKPAEPQYTRPKPTVDDKGEDDNPKYATYEDFVEDLSDWKAEQRLAKQQREQQQQEQQSKLQRAIEDGKSIYGDDFGKIADDTAGALVGDANVPLLVKQRIARSEMLPHLVYTIGSDSAELERFVDMAKADPFKALDYIALVENGIAEELAGNKADEAGRNDKGQFVSKEPPAKPKTSAPKPPTPVSGTSTGAFDVSDESLSPEEWMRQRNRQLGIK
jgi:hypothetical protein